MWKRFFVAGLVSSIALCCASHLPAHGGQYRGPNDLVPPNLGGGGDTTPPGNPGGSGTPIPGAPEGGGRPTTGGSGVAPGAPQTGPGRPTPATRGFAKRGGSGSFDRWEFWWEHNKEPFLNLKARLGSDTVASGSPGFLVGKGLLANADHSNRPTASDVTTRVLPGIVELLSERHADIVDSAALALGRMVRAEDGQEALNALLRTLGHNEKSAREAATLALGVLGSPEAFDPLVHLMMDDTEGRRLTHHPNGVEDLVRAFAAASLGMLRDARAVAPLKEIIGDDRLLSQLDLKAMAITALGLMPRETHEDVVPFLLGVMEGSMNRYVRAQAPVALGRLHTESVQGSMAATAALSKIVRLLESDRTDHDLGRSLALCLGQIARVSDTEALDALRNAIQRSSDDQVRHFSIMALAQIGFRDEQPEAHAGAHAELEDFFLRELTRPNRVSHKPYGALGLAVYARNERLLGTRVRAGEKILEAFESTNNPSNEGAMAIALGLLDHAPAREALWARFGDSNDQSLKGYLAVALGLMKARQHGEALRTLLPRKGLEYKFRLQLARSLGLMGDTQAVGALLRYLEEAETTGESAGSAQSLGLIGDRSALEPLLLIARDASKQEIQRGFAVVALGILCEKSSLPWNAVFSVNSNYRAKLPALSEILDIL